MGAAASIPLDQVDAPMLEKHVRQEGPLFAEYANTIHDNRIDGATVREYFAQGDEGAAALLDDLKVTNRLHRNKFMGMLKNAVAIGGAAGSATAVLVPTGPQELTTGSADAADPAVVVASAVKPAPEMEATVEEVVEPGPSMRSVFDPDRGGGAMVAMEGGVLDQGTTTGIAAAGEAAEYKVGDEVLHQGEVLFTIVRVLGNGAFGEVYEGAAAAGGGLIALKSVKPSLAPEKKRQLQTQLAEESAICFAVGTHAHLVSVRRVLLTPKGLLIAMDLVEGTDLLKYAGRDHNGPLYQQAGGREAVNRCIDSLVAQMYLGLAHLHERAVLHMDIKPEVGALCKPPVPLTIVQ